MEFRGFRILWKNAGCKGVRISAKILAALILDGSRLVSLERLDRCIHEK
jgi:hypothetical protein